MSVTAASNPMPSPQGTSFRDSVLNSDSSDRLIMDLFRGSRDRFSSLDVGEELGTAADQRIPPAGEDRSLKKKPSAADSRQLLLSNAQQFGSLTGSGDLHGRFNTKSLENLLDQDQADQANHLAPLKDNFVLEWAHSVDPDDWGWSQIEGEECGTPKSSAQDKFNAKIFPVPETGEPLEVVDDDDEEFQGEIVEGDEEYVPTEIGGRKRRAVVRSTAKSATDAQPTEDTKKRKCTWRKYGQKVLKGKEFVGMDVIRCYYRCNVRGCKVKKQVEKASWQTDADASVSVTGIHSHPYENDAASGDDGGDNAADGTTPGATVARSHRGMRDPPPVPPLNKVLSNDIRESSPHFVISDPSRVDCPIIFASPGFCRLTGYSLDECVGRNCRFLQGKDSNPNAVRQISMACKLQKEIRVILLNYKKDGTPFWNLLHITPVKDSDGNLISYVGVQMDVSEKCAAMVAT